jgi:hypothetical protein
MICQVDIHPIEFLRVLTLNLRNFSNSALIVLKADIEKELKDPAREYEEHY